MTLAEWAELEEAMALAKRKQEELDAIRDQHHWKQRYEEERAAHEETKAYLRNHLVKSGEVNRQLHQAIASLKPDALRAQATRTKLALARLLLRKHEYNGGELHDCCHACGSPEGFLHGEGCAWRAAVTDQ